MSREDPKVNIRLPADLKEQLHTLAAENKRSVNAEVVAAIENAIRSNKLAKSREEKLKQVDADGKRVYMTVDEAQEKLVKDVILMIFEQTKDLGK